MCVSVCGVVCVCMCVWGCVCLCVCVCVWCGCGVCVCNKIRLSFLTRLFQKINFLVEKYRNEI
jgi:hypothetical protein